MIALEILPMFCVGPLRIGSDAPAVYTALGACEHRENRTPDVSTDFWLGGRFQVHYAGASPRVTLIEVALDPRVVPRLFGIPLFAKKASELKRQIASFASVHFESWDSSMQCVCPSLELALRRNDRDDDYFSGVAVGRLGYFSSAERGRALVR